MKFVREILTPFLLILLTGIVVYDHVLEWGGPGTPPSPDARVDGRKLGRGYAAALADTYADAWDAGAAALEQGKSVAAAQKTLVETWKRARASVFKTQVAPAMARVLPEGHEPGDPAVRAAVVKLWKDFARGLRGK